MMTLCISVVRMREEAGLVRVSASPPPPPPDTADTHRDIIELHSHSAQDTIIGNRYCCHGTVLQSCSCLLFSTLEYEDKCQCICQHFSFLGKQWLRVQKHAWHENDILFHIWNRTYLHCILFYFSIFSFSIFSLWSRLGYRTIWRCCSTVNTKCSGKKHLLKNFVQQ